MAHSRADAPHGRWSRRRGQNTSRLTPAKARYQRIIENDALETQVQNEMSPFPPTYREHVSRREIPFVYASDPPSLRDLSLTIAAKYFSSHVLPVHEAKRLDVHTVPRDTTRSRLTKRARHDNDEYVPDKNLTQLDKDKKKVRQPVHNFERWREINGQLLDEIPPQLMDTLLDLVCQYAPEALSREIFARYFMPDVSTRDTRDRVRPRLFFPASLPLFSQQPASVALLLARLTGTLSLAPSEQVTRFIRAIDIHGMTRLSSTALTGLFKVLSAPHSWALDRFAVRGCLALDDRVVSALVAASGATLKHVDLTMTSVSTASLSMLGSNCPLLETLKMAWCEDFTETSVASAVSACVGECAHATPPRIPFQKLKEVDLSHTNVGDVAVGGLMRMCGKQLVTLDVGYTMVADSGSLDMLALGLGLGSGSQLKNVDLSGLCVHGVSLVTFLERMVEGASAPVSFALNDIREFMRRDATSLQGYSGLSGDVLHAIARLVGQHGAQRVSVRGDKRQQVQGHWALERNANKQTLGETLSSLMGNCTYLDLGGLAMPAQELCASMPIDRPLRELHLGGTALRDDSLMKLAAWTGSLESLYLDETLVTGK